MRNSIHIFFPVVCNLIAVLGIVLCAVLFPENFQELWPVFALIGALVILCIVQMINIKREEQDISKPL